MSLNLLMRVSGRSSGRRENHQLTKKPSKATAMATKTMSGSGTIDACSVRERELDLVSGSLERLDSTLDPVQQAAFHLDRQRPDDLIGAWRCGVFDRWSIIDVLADSGFVLHVRPPAPRLVLES